MKKSLNKIIAVLTGSLIVAGCEVNDLPEITRPLDFTTAAKVKFFFHVDGAPRAIFYMNGTKVTSIAQQTKVDPVTGRIDTLLQGHAYGSVFPSNNYAEVPAGDYSMRVDTLAVANPAVKAELVKTNVSLKANTFYSAYLVGTKTSYETFIIEDKLPPEDHTKIWWRFMNTMAEMPFKVDVYAIRTAVPPSTTDPNDQGDPGEVITLGKNLGFKEHGEYVELPKGTYTWKVFPAGTTGDFKTLKSYIQQSFAVSSLGRVYTHQIRGTYAAVPKSNQMDYWRER